MNEITLEEDGSAAVLIDIVPEADVLVILSGVSGKTFRPAITFPVCEHHHRSTERALSCGIRVLLGRKK